MICKKRRNHACVQQVLLGAVVQLDGVAGLSWPCAGRVLARARVRSTPRQSVLKLLALGVGR